MPDSNLTAEQRLVFDETLARLRTFGCDERAATEAARNKALAIDVVGVKERTSSALPVADARPALVPETALALLNRDMPAIRKLNTPWIVEGLNLVVSRPKLGKSTLCRQKAAAVASGTPFLGAPTEQAVAAFLSLEEGDRLAKAKFTAAGFSDDALANTLLFFKWRRGSDGIDDLSRFLDDYPAVRYVVIDSLTRFRSVPDHRTPAFQADYEAVAALHAVAKARPGLCLDVIHHTRKAKSDDPIEDISGTFGISAAADSYCILRHHEDGALMHAGGRLWDRDVSAYRLTRANQRWELAGPHRGLSAIQQETLQAVQAAPGGMTPSQLAERAGITKQSAQQRLQALVDHGAVIARAGRYAPRGLLT